jgi:hypothetical protein
MRRINRTPKKKTRKINKLAVLSSKSYNILIVNGLHFPIKGQRVTEWMGKDQPICSLTKNSLQL